LDPKDPDRYVVAILHGGLGLPDRDYYLRDDATFPGVRDQYRAHIERLLTLAGDADAATAAAHILTLETEIAKLHWPRADRPDRDKTYNPQTRAELAALAPDFPWNEFFAAAELPGVENVLVIEKSAIGPLAQLFRATPVEDWRRYLRYH